MHPSSFDQLTRRLRSLSRRDLARALLFAATAVPLTPVRVARSQSARVPPGDACANASDCQRDDMRGEMLCADNGFTSDGPLNCCAEEGCCTSDADCCGDLRCAPTGDVCSVCLRPPFPTRLIGQRCDDDSECVPSVTCEVGCLSRRCVCLDPAGSTPSEADTALPLLPEEDSALAFAEWLSLLEASERYDILYRAMHPDAKAIVPANVVTLWFRRLAPTRGAEVAEALKVRFIPWTWGVTGKTYPNTAEVAFRQRLWNGAIVRDEIRLAKDDLGNWGWFFGRDRAFVEEQIARFGD